MCVLSTGNVSPRGGLEHCVLVVVAGSDSGKIPFNLLCVRRQIVVESLVP